MPITSRLRSLVAAACLAVGLAAVGAPTPPAAAQDIPKAETPVFVTSLGQSLDAFQVQLLLRRAGVAYEYDPLGDVDKLGDAKTLFLVVGASLKGFGEAGIGIDQEIARANNLMNEAEARGLLIVVLHTGGEERRDDLSNQLIALVAPRADVLYIRNDSDADGMFAGIASANDIPVTQVENLVALLAPVKELFEGGAGL